MSTPADPALELSQLRKQLRSPWTTTSGDDAGAVSSAAIASADLARRAYGEGDVDARWRAESILYFVNLDTWFAPPVEPTAAVVWTTLMRAKLAGLRRELAADLDHAELDAAGLREQLLQAVARWGAYNHPVLDDLERTGSLAAYRIWAKNWFGSCQGFSLQLASLFQRTTGGARRAVLENLSDELTSTAEHDDLRLRFYESLGIRHSAEQVLADPDWVLESTELLNLRTGLCTLADPMPALGCFYGVEANWPPECQRHHAMNTRRGLDERTIEYWTTHAFVDLHHADEWLEATQSLCSTAAQRAAVLEGAVIQLRLRWRMYDAIRGRIASAAAA